MGSGMLYVPGSPASLPWDFLCASTAWLKCHWGCIPSLSLTWTVETSISLLAVPGWALQWGEQSSTEPGQHEHNSLMLS